MHLRLIGYWQSSEHPEYPDPRDFVDPDWDGDERHQMAVYLAGGTHSRHYMGLSPCRLCGKNNGALELTDGVYAWPEGLLHYVEDHDVRLPAEFAKHAMERLEALEDAEHNLGWWLDTCREQPGASSR